MTLETPGPGQYELPSDFGYLEFYKSNLSQTATKLSVISKMNDSIKSDDKDSNGNKVLNVPTHARIGS